MRIVELVWDDANLDHIARHGVLPGEVEDVCFGEHIAYRGQHLRYILYGQTQAGRYLMVVLAKRAKDHYRPVTARDLTPAEKRSYRSEFTR